MRHPASPWRCGMFVALARLSHDSDVEVPQWLQGGAPMGIAVPILPGGHFPCKDLGRELEPQELEPLGAASLNHPSFSCLQDEDGVTGTALIEACVDAGFGELFSDRKSAAQALGGQIFPAPLGDVAKPRPGGGVTHRLIQDLRANRVNDAVSLPERQVLPRPIDHAVALARFEQRRQSGHVLMVGVADFAEAFQSVPLDPRERRFNCAEVTTGLRRSRAPLQPRTLDGHRGSMAGCRLRRATLAIHWCLPG